MKVQRTALFSGLLAALVALVVAGVAARSTDEAQTWSRGERRDQNRDEPRPGVLIAQPGDRQVFRFDGRGSQIGVMVSDLEDASATGVKVDEVERGSAAEKAGVKAGDIVVDFDGERVRSARQLTRLVRETPSGRTVKMTVRRGADRQTMDVTPETDSVAGNFEWRMDRDFEREIERGVEEGLRDLPRRMEPYFDFRGGFGTRARLGVQVQPLNDQLGEYFGVKDGGVLVSRVTADSPAAKAGLKAGDVITKVNGESVRDPGDLTSALADVKDDGAVALDIVRDKKASTLKATIERPRTSRPARNTRPA
jgi:serine protease Do